MTDAVETRAGPACAPRRPPLVRRIVWAIHLLGGGDEPGAPRGPRRHGRLLDLTDAQLRDIGLSRHDLGPARRGEPDAAGPSPLGRAWR